MKKLRITVDGRTYDVTVHVLEDDEAAVTGAGFVSPLPPPPARAVRSTPAPAPAAARMPADQPDAIQAPIAGTVQKVFVEAGARVEAKSPVVLLDAMKMDTYIYAPRTMRVTEVSVAPGQSVQVGDRLIRFTPED